MQRNRASTLSVDTVTVISLFLSHEDLDYFGRFTGHIASFHFSEQIVILFVHRNY